MDNSIEILRVLKLVEEGKISAEDGASLINALTAKAETTDKKEDDKDLFNKDFFRGKFDSRFADKFGANLASHINKALNRTFVEAGDFGKKVRVFHAENDCDCNNGDCDSECNGKEKGSCSAACNIDVSKLFITNKATIKAGNYSDVRVLGSATIEEGVTIDNLSVNGSCIAAKGFIVDNARINGSLELSESATFDNCRILGSLTSLGSLKCDNISISGTGEMVDVECDNLFASGSVIVSGTLTADEVRLKGIFDIATIAADNVDIRVERSYTGNNSRRKTKSIKCYEIKAEHFVCDTLECNEAELGRGCNIREITCDEITADDLKCDILRCREHKLGDACEVKEIIIRE